MPEILNTLSAVGVADTTSYVVPVGWQYVSGTYRITSQAFALLSGTDAFIRDNKTLTGLPVGCRVRVVNMSSDSRGAALLDNSGNGYVILCNATNIRLFAVTAFVTQTGSVLKTIATALSNNDTVDLMANGTSYTVRRNGVAIDTPYVGTSYSGLRAVGCSRAAGGRFDQLTSIETTSFLIDTLTSPLVPNAAFSGTCTGFADGAATLSFSGVSIGVTIASGAFSGTIPMLADTIVWPRLPATGQTITLTQGGNTATIARDISLPSGYDTVRDGLNAVANFSGLVADDDSYLQYWFLAASNPLTTSDTAYFGTSDNYKIYQDSGVGADTASLPRTDTIFIQRSGGTIYEHTVALDVNGSIVGVSSKNNYIGFGIGVGF